MSEEQRKKDQDQPKEKPKESNQESMKDGDPQEHMEGPISSLVQAVSDGADSDETKEEADQKKAENM